MRVDGKMVTLGYGFVCWLGKLHRNREYYFPKLQGPKFVFRQVNWRGWKLEAGWRAPELVGRLCFQVESSALDP